MIFHESTPNSITAVRSRTNIGRKTPTLTIQNVKNQMLSENTALNTGRELKTRV